MLNWVKRMTILDKLTTCNMSMSGLGHVYAGGSESAFSFNHKSNKARDTGTKDSPFHLRLA